MGPRECLFPRSKSALIIRLSCFRLCSLWADLCISCGGFKIVRCWLPSSISSVWACKRFEMLCHSEYRTDITESEFEEYEYTFYKEMSNGSIKVKGSVSTYICPFCSEGRRDYLFEELLQHASDVHRGSQLRRLKDKARHSALEKYLRRHVKEKDNLESTQKIERDRKRDERFVWPWMGIIANIPTQLKDGRHVGESGSRLRDELMANGFDPVRVHPLWNRDGHSGFAIVEFKQDWSGFNKAIMFEKKFEVDHCGRKNYYNVPANSRGNRLYGWVAREADYRLGGLISNHLNKYGDLKSLPDIEDEDQRKTSTLVSDLTHTLQKKHEHLREMESKCIETNTRLTKLMHEKEAMVKHYNEEIRKMQKDERDHIEKVYLEQNKTKLQLEAQRKELEQHEKQLQERQVHNEDERRKLWHEKKMIDRATMEQKKADQDMLRLAEEHKGEKEKLHKKMIELDKKLDNKQALQLEIERLKGSLQVMKHMGEDEDMGDKKKMEKIQQDLEEKQQDLEALDLMNQALIIKERRSNDELQEARKELINGLKEANSCALIGVKKMGDLDNNLFCAAIKSHFSDEEADLKAAELCSLWDSRLRDPNWHPFKIITDERGNCKEIINENDEQLKALKCDYDDDAYHAVIRALMQMNEYNPSGRYPVPELWNFKTGRKATLGEAALYIVRRWKALRKRKRN